MQIHKSQNSAISETMTTSLAARLPGLVQIGGPGNDSLYGSLGDDTMRGWGGDDWIIGWAGNDLMEGGAGIDQLYGRDNDDTLYGENGQDSLFGDAGNDLLYGGLRLDRLWGDDGNDTLHGGDGDDNLNGGNGADVLYGGAGADTFYFVNLPEVGLAPGTRDRIMDFEVGIDRISVGGIDADAIHSGNNVFRLSTTGLHDGAPGSLRVVTQNGNTFVMADRDGDRLSDFSIEIAGVHALTAADFLL